MSENMKWTLRLGNDSDSVDLGAPTGFEWRKFPIRVSLHSAQIVWISLRRASSAAPWPIRVYSVCLWYARKVCENQSVYAGCEVCCTRGTCPPNLVCVLACIGRCMGLLKTRKGNSNLDGQPSRGTCPNWISEILRAYRPLDLMREMLMAIAQCIVSILS
jgi:hypothetical protein